MMKQHQQQRAPVPQSNLNSQQNLQSKQIAQKTINHHTQDFSQQNMKKIFKRASYHVAIAYNIYLKKVMEK